MTYTTDSEVTTVTVTCDVGSSISGTAEILCGNNGEWEIQSNVSCGKI